MLFYPRAGNASAAVGALQLSATMPATILENWCTHMHGYGSLTANRIKDDCGTAAVPQSSLIPELHGLNAAISVTFVNKRKRHNLTDQDKMMILFEPTKCTDNFECIEHQHHRLQQHNKHNHTILL